jgi:hypothetical protein
MLQNLVISLGGGCLSALVNLFLYGLQPGVWVAFIIAFSFCFVFNIIMDMLVGKK